MKITSKSPITFMKSRSLTGFKPKAIDPNPGTINETF